jgi:hypothetical protein
MGLGVEKALTGKTEPRDPFPPPQSIVRLQESDPAGRLSNSHRDRLVIEDNIKTKLTEHGLLITGDDIRATVNQP